MSSIEKLPTNLIEEICLSVGYYETLTILGPRIFVDYRFKRFLLREGGPGKLLETTLQRGADISTLLIIKPLIPSYIALAVAIMTTQNVAAVKRVCIIWNTYRCDFAFMVSKTMRFPWGLQNLYDELPYNQHDVNGTYAFHRQFDKIDFTILRPLKNVAADNWLYEQIGETIFDHYGEYTLCLYTTESNLDSSILGDHFKKRLNNDEGRKMNFKRLMQSLIRGKRFNLLRTLYEPFHEHYGEVDMNEIEYYFMQTVREIVEQDDENKKLKTECLESMSFFNLPQTEIYRALLLKDENKIVHYLRNEPDEMLYILQEIEYYGLLHYTPFTDQLTDEEYQRVNMIIDYSGRVIPRLIDENSSLNDIITYFEEQSEEKCVEMIKNGAMKNFSHILQRIGEPNSNLAYLKAYIETYGVDQIMSFSFKIHVCSKEQFLWLVDLLIKTKHKGDTVKLTHRTVEVTKGIVFYADLAFNGKQKWKSIYFNTFFPEYLKLHLAFWNYFEDERMFFY